MKIALALMLMADFASASYVRRQQVNGVIPSYNFVVSDVGGLVSHYKLDEESGTDAADRTGTNPGALENTPTLGAAGATIAGNTNKAMTFAAASNEDVLIADNNSLDFTTQMTIIQHFKTNTAGAIFTLSKHGTDGVGGYESHLGAVQAGDLRFLIHTGTVTAGGDCDTANYDCLDTADTSFTDNTYKRVALVWDGTVGGSAGGTAYVWSSGVQDANKRIMNVASIPTNARKMRLGARNDVTDASPSLFFNGSLDEVALYNQVLDARCIKLLTLNRKGK